MALYPG